ncbi:MAG: ABC transporter substrate-binding protein [Anaerolineaceae bacterium]|nr:ABC transporter substrate-binding protein [Anaerolineaceae bacterium]
MPKKSVTFVIALVVIASMLLSACATATQAPATEAPAATEVPATEAPAAKQQVEVFSWWTGGGEAAGLDAMIKIWQAKYPDIEFVNAAVAGGAGSNAKAVLATRLSAGDPPDSFQGHAGQELIGTYVKAGQLEPLDDLYKANGWYDVFPATLIPLISADGHPYSVPVNIHRANVMWYNPKVLAQYNVTAPDASSFQSWIDSMDALQKAGMQYPLALGEQWTVVQLYETVLLATVGPQTYTDLWNGAADWNSDGVKESLVNFAKVMTYANTDYATLTWQDASKLVADGDAAFNVMGDWADGYFEGSVDGGNLGLAEKTDFDWMPVPGTKGSYDFLSDSFVLPVGAKDRDAALAWLTLCGSKEGQDAFNPVKGSISARSDSDASLYNPYLQSAMADWKSDVVVGSLWHGVVANDTWKAAINDAFGKFLTDGDQASLQATLVSSCAADGPCK